MRVKSTLKNEFPHLYKLYCSYQERSYANLCKVNPKKAVEKKIGKIDWNNPKNINEKLQCLKLGEYYNNQIITNCCDKVLVKEWIKTKGTICKTAETYGVYDNPDQIRWSDLPNKFVIKCNHGSGYNIICDDKSKIDIIAIKQTLRKWLKEDYWTEFCETQYKYIKKKIIIEENLGHSISTYKFYCFNGQPKVMYISSNGENGEIDKYFDFFDMNFQWQDIRLKYHMNNREKIKKPECWNKLVEIVKSLSKEFKFVRVDLYVVKGDIYLSEMTFMPTGGYMSFDKPEVLIEWGNWLSI